MFLLAELAFEFIKLLDFEHETVGNHLRSFPYHQISLLTATSLVGSADSGVVLQDVVVDLLLSSLA